jgi:DNA replicative helicase MCM subunit Mcm2 (Cdc46/Mcm family)
MSKRKLTPFRRKYLNFRIAEQRRKLKRRAIEYKGGKCVRCGYDKCPGALTFHHLDPNQKDFGISSQGITRSFEKIKTELDKCILLCHNCHAELHHEEDEKERERKLQEIELEKRSYNNKVSIEQNSDLAQLVEASGC